jgi:Collagen triple helix repeat (20 copies)
MFSAIRKRLHLTPSTLIASLALMFAMSGGAYAASKYVITSTKQIKPSVLKSLQGKAGAKGAQGAAGAAGIGGAAGPQGGVGATGAKGETGTAGAAGVPGEKGATGAKGATGSPWTTGGVLPSKATETGAYVISSATGAPTRFEEYVAGSISFPIPLAKELGEEKTIFVASQGGFPGAPPTECQNTEHPGEASPSNPEAAPGFLCVYEATVFNMKASETIIFNPAIAASGAAVSGATLLQPATGAEAQTEGTWAVTAE